MNTLVDPHSPVHISAADWGKGIGLSLAASLIAGASKLAIRKSWLLQASQEQEGQEEENEEEGGDEYTAETHYFSSTTVEEEEEEDTENLLSPSHRRTRTKESSLFKDHFFLLRCSGMFGMSLLNPICSVFAMNYASPSILAPFAGLTLVWVILFSSSTVGEQPSPSEISAAILIMLGEIIVAVFGDHTNDEGRTVEDVRQSYKEPATISYFAVLTLYMIVLGYWILYSKETSLKRFAWGSCGGTITGPQNFLKDSLTILKAASNLGEAVPWFFPLLIVFALLTSLSGLLLLTACMKRYDATYSAAAFVGSFVVSASINAACHYNTFTRLPSTWNDILYPLGLIVLMFGVYILETSSHHREKHETENQEVSNNHDGIRERKDSDDSQTPFAYAQVETQVEMGS